jgi:hypothetical protein
LERWTGEWTSLNTLKYVRLSRDGNKRGSTFPQKVNRDISLLVAASVLVFCFGLGLLREEQLSRNPIMNVRVYIYSMWLPVRHQKVSLIYS